MKKSNKSWIIELTRMRVKDDAKSQKAIRSEERNIREDRVVIDGKHHHPWSTREEQEAAASFKRRDRLWARPGIRHRLLAYAFLRGVPLAKAEAQSATKPSKSFVEKIIKDHVRDMFPDPQWQKDTMSECLSGLDEWLGAGAKETGDAEALPRHPSRSGRRSGRSTDRSRRHPVGDFTAHRRGEEVDGGEQHYRHLHRRRRSGAEE
jgi:hypothetical protein